MEKIEKAFEQGNGVLRFAPIGSREDVLLSRGDVLNSIQMITTS